MISIDNAALERVLKHLILSQEIEHNKDCCLVFTIERHASSSSLSDGTNLNNYDLVGRFTTYSDKAALIEELAQDLHDATQELHGRMNEVVRLAISIRNTSASPRAKQINGVRLRKGFTVLSTGPERPRPKKRSGR